MTKKKKIIKTALELIVAQGIQETPMSQISKESGVAIGTIYYHFRSKSELVNAIYVFLKQEMGQALLEVNKETKDYRELFFRFWHNLFVFYIQNEVAFKFLQTFTYSPLILEESKQQGLKYYHPIIEFFQEGQLNGILLPLNISLMTEIIHGNIVSLVQIYFQKTIEINEIIINQAVTMSWNSVANQKIYYE